MADPGPVPDPAPMTLSCQRCGARDRAWTISTTTAGLAGSYWMARLCGLCVRSVLADIEAGAPYADPVMVRIDLLDAG